MVHIKKKRTKTRDVTGKWAKNRLWGLSILDIPVPCLNAGSEGQGWGWRGGGGLSSAGAWSGMMFHKCIADGKKLCLWNLVVVVLLLLLLLLLLLFWGGIVYLLQSVFLNVSLLNMGFPQMSG